MTTATAETGRIDADLRELRGGAQRWIELSAEEKAGLLERLRESVYTERERWVAAASAAKGITGTPLEGEEWISGPWAVLYAINRYIDTLRVIARTGSPHVDPARLRTRTDGQLVVDVFPATLSERLLLSGIRAEVWMQHGITAESLPATAGLWYRESVHRPRVALVLGAGNISSIAPLDVLYKLVADGATCMLKMNPVNDYLGPVFQDALKPLCDEGFVRFAYGGADVGKYLSSHAGIDEIHITGSDKTHDAIVFGDGPDAAQRKLRNEPLLTKHITSELGNVSPTIVVPGDWSDADFRFQAENIATQKLHNAGFNCIASQVLIAPSQWDGTPKLLAHIEDVFAELRDRPAYYPGAAGRHARQSAHRERIAHFGHSGDGFLSRTVLHVRSDDADTAFREEAFGSVLAVTSIPGDTQAYLSDAVAFANESLWGTLGANIIVHPATMREHAAALDTAIAALRYGCIGVNAWTGVGYFVAETPWGAFPGHTPDNIQSGIGVVHNSHLFSRAEKSVVYAAFAPFPRSFRGYGNSLMPKPPWFVTNKAAARIGRALCDFEYHKTPLTMAAVAFHAMSG